MEWDERQRNLIDYGKNTLTDDGEVERQRDDYDNIDNVTAAGV